MKKVRVAIGLGALTPAALALAPTAAHAATRIVTCGTAPNHWTEFARSGVYSCFGYNGGTWDASVLNVSKECGGNNYGWYKGGGARSREKNFIEGTTWATLPSDFISLVSSVHISGWSGTDTCRAP